MKVELINTTLYPRFTPYVAKIGGNAKVYTVDEYRRFLSRYFRRNPAGTMTYLFEPEKNHVIMPWLRKQAETVGVKQPLKIVYRSLRGDPVVSQPSGPALPTPRPNQRLTLPIETKPVLIVVIDTEENFDWDAPFSSASTAVHGMREIETVQTLFDRYNVRPIYVVDYSIASQPAGYEPLRRILEDGRCEIGAHVHPWV